LIAVAVVGLSHSASAAADAKIFITNKASNLTTESPAPSGRTTASTVYGTYTSSTRETVDHSNRFIVTVVDPDLNSAPLTLANDANQLGTAGFEIVGTDADRDISSDIIEVVNNDTDLTDIGDQFRVILDDDDYPIVGSASDIKICQGSLTDADADGDLSDDCVEVGGLAVSDIFATGNGTTTKGIVTINVIGAVTGLTEHDDDEDALTANGGTISILYPTSDYDTADVTVKSVVNPDGVRLTLTETDRNSGRFEGEVEVIAFGSAAAAAGGRDTDAAMYAVIDAEDGAITVKYTDALTSGTATGVTRTVSAMLDTIAPTVTFSGPVNGSETQNRKPTFTGTVSDANSGIDAGTFTLYIDQSFDDSANDTPVANATTGAFVADDNANVVLSATDGANSANFSHTPSTDIPSDGDDNSNPNHVVDFQALVADLAGNVGYSDADTANNDLVDDGYLGNMPHTVKIDQQIPVISSSITGKGYNSADATTDLTNVRDTIKLIFDGNVKASSISASDFKVTLSGSGAVFVPASLIVSGKNVYLDIDSTIPSDDRPTVALQGTIQDMAGNSTDAGSSQAADGIAPVITVTRSGGTGTGTGSEGPDSLTKEKMTITVTSDENLVSAPDITVKNLSNETTVENATAGVPQGGNVWKLTVSDADEGSLTVKVVATDGTNETEVGDETTKAYTVDNEVVEPSSSPSTTTQPNPFITVDYAEDLSSITVTSATLDGVDVTSHVVASADNKKFFFQPVTALTNGAHKFIIKVKDAAGNTLDSEVTVTKSSRTDFVIQLFAGWNAVSVPSNPVDASIGSVFSNSGVKQVIAYDASTPAQPWRIASKVDGSFSSQTEPGLTSVNAGHGYWVETSDFENQKVALQGPTGPGDARPGLTTIPTGNGWNFVGVVDQSRIQTQATDRGTTLVRATSDNAQQDEAVDLDSYLSTVNFGRAYTFDTVASEFRVENGADEVKIGSGLWVFISPQQNGKLPHIVP